MDAWLDWRGHKDHPQACVGLDQSSYCRLVDSGRTFKFPSGPWNLDVAVRISVVSSRYPGAAKTARFDF